MNNGNINNFRDMIEKSNKIKYTKSKSKILFETLFNTPFSKIINENTFKYKLNIPENQSKKIFEDLIDFKVFKIEEDVMESWEENKGTDIEEDYSLFFKVNGYIPSELQRDLKIDLKKRKKFFDGFRYED